MTPQNPTLSFTRWPLQEKDGHDGKFPRVENDHGFPWPFDSPTPNPEFLPADGVAGKLTPSLMSLKHREGCSRWVFDPGIFGDCKKKEGVGSQRGTAHLSNPIAPLGDKTHPPRRGRPVCGRSGRVSVVSQALGPGKTRTSPHTRPPGPSASPKVNALAPRCRHR